MSGWYYSAVKVKADFGDDHEYTVGEVYPSLDQKGAIAPHGISTQFYGDTPEDLVKWLRRAADDIERFGCVNEEE